MAMLSTDDTPTHHVAVAVALSTPRSHLAAFAASVAALLIVVLLSACGSAGATGNAKPTQPAGHDNSPAQDRQRQPELRHGRVHRGGGLRGR